MDREILDYLDQKWFMLASKEDLEKLRQEMKAALSRLREAGREEELGWRQEVKGDLDALKKENLADLIPLVEETKAGLKGIREDLLPSILRAQEKFESTLLQYREEAKAGINQSTQDMGALLQSLWKEERQSFSNLIKEAPQEANRWKEGMEKIDGQVRELTQGLAAIHETLAQGIKQMKEELGSMIKFSSADLDRKISALEARIKALEKITFP